MKLLIAFVLVLFSPFIGAQSGFIENKGQWPSQVLFAVDFQDGKLFVERDGYRVHQWDLKEWGHAAQFESPEINALRTRGHVYEVKWQGSNVHSFVAGNKLFAQRFHFFLGSNREHWAGDCRSFKEVIQYNVYPGIDLVWKLDSEKGVKYEWRIHSDGNAGLIRWKYAGLDDVMINGNKLSVRHSLGNVQDEIEDCFIMQNKQWRKLTSNIHFRQDKKGIFSFASLEPLKSEWVIDPVLVFSTFSGSTSDNFGYTATYDAQGFLYSGSSAFGQGYPTTLGAYQTTWAGGDGSGTLAGTDIALTKYSMDGTQLIWSTFLGGDRDELPHSLVVNEQNELLFYGSTGSFNFPVTTSAFDTTFNAGNAFTPQGIGTTYAFGSDVILGRLSTDGSELLQSTYFGGTGNDGVNTASGLKFNYADEFRGEIDLAPNGQVVIVGTTNSQDFPTTLMGGASLQDAFIAVWSADLSALIWSKKWGGSDDESGCSVAFDNNNNIWVCGGTQSTDLNVSNNAHQTQFSGGTSDGWLLKLSPNGTQVAASYWGSSVYDQLYFIDTDEVGNPYVYGQSLAAGSTWISNAGWSQPNSGMYVAKWSAELSSVEWSTVFGSGSGVPNLSPAAFLVDVCGQIYLSGWGGSVNQGSNASVGNTQGLWLSNDAYQNTTNGSDFYLLVMDQSADFPVYATYFGGGISAEHVDGGTSRFDRKGVIYQSVCAGCGSHDDFPIFPSNAWSPINGSNNCNNGVFKFDFELPLTYVNALFPEEICLGESVFFTADTQQVSQLQWLMQPMNEVISMTPNFNFVFQDTGMFYVQLMGISEFTCNGVDSSGHWIHVRGPQNQNLLPLSLCYGDTVMVGIQNPLPNANYSWIAGQGILNDSVFWSPYVATLNEDLVLLQQGGWCVDTIKQSIEVTQLDLSLSDDLALCNPQTVNLELIVQPPNANIQWATDSDMVNTIGNAANLAWLADSSVVLFANVSLNDCTLQDSVFIQVLNVQSSLFTQETWCAWDTVMLSVPNPLSQCQYDWQANPQIISALDSSAVWVLPIQSSWYYVTTSIPGCSVLDSVWLESSVLDMNQTQLSAASEYIASGTSVLVECTPSGFEYSWSPMDLVLSDSGNEATFVLSEDTWISVDWMDGQCRLSDSVLVKVESVICADPFIYVPNVFSPNNDGLHDAIGIQSTLPVEVFWMIRDRMGNEVFKTNALEESWNGTYRGVNAEPGVYHYYLKVSCPNGEVWEKEGNITLMR